MVYVNAGDNRGQQGKVLSVDAAKQRAVVEGVNILRSLRRRPTKMQFLITKKNLILING